jgi:hypothetical protein
MENRNNPSPNSSVSISSPGFILLATFIVLILCLSVYLLVVPVLHLEYKSMRASILLFSQFEVRCLAHSGLHIE